MNEDIEDLFLAIEDHFDQLYRWEFPANFVDLVRRQQMPGWRIEAVPFHGRFSELLLELADDGLPMRGFHLVEGHNMFCDYPDGIIGVRVPIQIEMTDE
jgi:hypothetical protein